MDTSSCWYLPVSVVKRDRHGRQADTDVDTSSEDTLRDSTLARHAEVGDKSHGAGDAAGHAHSKTDSREEDLPERLGDGLQEREEIPSHGNSK